LSDLTAGPTYCKKFEINTNNAGYGFGWATLTLDPAPTPALTPTPTSVLTPTRTLTSNVALLPVITRREYATIKRSDGGIISHMA
jgi:hypothetical protein